MSRVDFYILPDDQLSNLQKYACELAESHWKSGKRVLIQTDSSDDSQQLNELLWSFRKESFIPHGIASLEPVDEQQPVLISHHRVIDSNFQQVINLSSRPSDITNSDNLNIEELLNQNEQRKKTGRLHYKTYRELGYTLEHHTLETVNGEQR